MRSDGVRARRIPAPRRMPVAAEPRRDGSELDREPQPALHVLGAGALRLGLAHRVVGDAPEELLERDAGLRARHVHAEAEVDAVAEAEHAARAAQDVEAVGLREFALVAVRRGEEEAHLLAGPQPPGADRQLLDADAALARRRRVEP